MALQQVLRFPEVNGAHCSFVSIELGLAGALPIQAFKSINYKDAITVGRVRGTSANIIGRTRGINEPTGEIEFYRAQFDQVLPFLAAAGGTAQPGRIRVGYAEGAYPLTVTYAEASMPNLTRTDLLMGVRFLDADSSNSEGADALTVKMKLDLMKILWHGYVPALR